MLSDKFTNRVLQLFVRFLKEEKILRVFNENLSSYLMKYDLVKYIKYNNTYNNYVLDMAHDISYLHKEDIHCLFLDYAMIWSKTEKGFVFWANVNRKWRECFYNNLRLINLEINEE